MFLNKLGLRFWLMLGRDIIVVCLLMDKLELENHIQWLDMGQTKVLSQFHVRKYLKGYLATQIKINNMKLTYPCFKFIMKKFKIF